MMKGKRQDNSTLTPFALNVIDIIRHIPKGRVTSYGMVARGAGSNRAARQVVRLLHSCSEKYGLPWQRVVNRLGVIPERGGCDHLLQRQILEEEGVQFLKDGRINLSKCLWIPGEDEMESLTGEEVYEAKYEARYEDK